MLTTELLVTYGFEKVPTTPLEKWSFENLVLYVEKNGHMIQFRVHDVHQPSLSLCVHSEAHFLQILKSIDEGGSLAAYVSELSGWHIYDSKIDLSLHDIQQYRIN